LECQRNTDTSVRTPKSKQASFTLTFNKTVQKGAYNKDKRQTIQRESEKTDKNNHLFLTIGSQ